MNYRVPFVNVPKHYQNLKEEILKRSKNPHQTYREVIKPQKLRLAVEYVKKRSFWLDIKIIFQTLKSAIF